MVPTILVALDGSPLAERAVPVAAALAAGIGARLLLVEVVHVPTPVGIDASAEQIAAMDGAEAYLREVALPLLCRGVRVDSAVLYGEVVGTIIGEARRHDAAFIALATHGRGGLGRLLFGSTAAALIDRAPAPLLLVRAWHARHAAEQIGPGAAILVPLDGSAQAEAALPVAREIAGGLDGTLVLVGAVPPADLALTPDGMRVALYEDDTATRAAALEGYLDRVAGRLVAGGCATRREIRIGAPARVIAAAGREHSAALTVMTTHGRTGVDRLLPGSVAEATLRAGVTPLIMIRPGARQGRGDPAAARSHESAPT